MKKTFKKAISMLLCLVSIFTLSFSVIHAGADDKEKSTWSTEWGDVAIDGKVTSTDARRVLRAAAKLEQLDERQTLNADVNRDGVVTSSDARQILRVAAKIDKFRVEVELTVGQEYVIDSVYDKAAYCWTCEVSPEQGLELAKTVEELEPSDIAGLKPEQIYTFTAKKPGTYEAVFKFSPVVSPDVRNEIIFTFIVK